MIRVRTTFVAAAALMVFGCGSGDASSSASSSTPTTAPAAEGKKLKIGVSIPSADHGWTAGVVYHANRVAELLMKEHLDESILACNSNPSELIMSDVEAITKGAAPWLL